MTRLYNIPLSNFPCEQWLREVSSDDFNTTNGITVVRMVRHAEVPAAPETGRQVQPAAVQEDERGVM
jgi:hypothetical protein